MRCSKLRCDFVEHFYRSNPQLNQATEVGGGGDWGFPTSREGVEYEKGNGIPTLHPISYVGVMRGRSVSLIAIHIG